MRKQNRSSSFALLCLAGVASAQSHWSWRNPLPQGNDLYDAIWTGDQFVTVGEGGVIFTSFNGTDWIDRSTQNRAHLHGVASHGSQIVAVGSYGQILSSPDGVAWTQQTTEPYSFGYWNSVEWIDSQFVAVGDGSRIMTSPNGIDWKYSTFPNSYGFEKVAAIGATQVIFTDTKLAYVSTNGAGWALAPTSTFPTTQIHGVAKLDTQLVAVGDSGTAWISSDGLNWTRTATPTNARLWSASRAGSKVIAIGDSGVMLTTVDGLSWTRSSIAKTPMGRVVWDGHQYVGFGSLGAIWISPDANQWTSVSIGSKSDINAMTRSDSQIVAVGDEGFIATSPDGIRWTTRNSATDRSLNTVAWTGSKFVAIGGEVVSSVDGANWTRDTILGTSVFALAWTDSQLVAAGNNGTILASPDGRRWTSRASGITTQLSSLAWTGNLLVAGSQDGQFLTSPDGISWTKRSSGTTQPIRSLVWTGTRIVSSDDDGVIRTSSDGQTWVATDTITDNAALTWTGNQLVAAGYLGSIYSSSDGTKWTPHRFNAWSDFKCITHIGKTIVAAGDGGLIASSPEDENASTRSRQPAKIGLRLTSNGDILRIRLDSPGDVRTVQAEIRTLSGRQVRTNIDLKLDDRGECGFPIGELPAGSYVLGVRLNAKVALQRFVVSR